MSACALLLAAAMAASGDVIDFENAPVGPIPDETLVYEFGDVIVTFTGPGLQIRQFAAPFPDTRILSSLSDAGPITATFEGATADFVEIENIINGTYTAEIDVINGTAFDSGGKQLDAQANAETIHHLEGPGIATVVYVENQPGKGFVLDNFEFVGVTCAADFNDDGSLDILDFVAFQTAWLNGDPQADCNNDDSFDILDFVCFQQLFVGGC
jgi:hypothetical protein